MSTEHGHVHTHMKQKVNKPSIYVKAHFENYYIAV